jgi:predicted small secreted protein
MKRLFALMLLAMFSVGSLSACNTVKGAGKDVQKVGERWKVLPTIPAPPIRADSRTDAPPCAARSHRKAGLVPAFRCPGFCTRT